MFIRCKLGYSSCTTWYIQGFLTEFGMLAFFTNLSHLEFQVSYLALFLLFSVIGGFGWLWMENLHKNIHFILEFLMGPFLVQHFSYYTLMILMMLSVILLSMLRMLLSTLNCHQASDLWQEPELVSELESDLWDTVYWSRKWACWFQFLKNSAIFVWLI